MREHCRADLEAAGTENHKGTPNSRAPMGVFGSLRRLLRYRKAMRLELTRRYALAASHRLHSPHLDDAENERIYGKCNNPYGHGHNYIVEVTVAGKVDPATGMIAHLGE